MTVIQKFELVKPTELKQTCPEMKETSQNTVDKNEAQLVTILDIANGEEIENTVGDK
jgi:hypothetical protein